MALTLQASLLVLAGGCAGGMARLGLATVVGERWGFAFPWGTLAVNVSGAFVIGVLAGLARFKGGFFDSDAFRALVFTGLLGGYTTVSSFALQTLDLGLAGERFRALSNVVLSAGLSLAAVAAGYGLAAGGLG
ncbi:Putative fluoride ion transporter CrcB [bacterium YEK0313]|nr:Putative fluoride ion transporter CrcB [bacterium YEK0313]